MIDLKSLNLSMESLKSLLRRRPERLGVDIEGDEARIVRLGRSKDGVLHLAAYGDAKFNLMDPTADQQRDFQLAIRRLGGNLTRVAVNIEDPSLRVRRMVLPRMPEADILEAIRWNFREHIEVPIEKYVVGYSLLSAAVEGNKMAVIGFGVARDAIDKYMEKFKGLGLRPISLEPVATALLASFYINGVLDDDRYHVCIVFGKAISNFAIFRKSEMLFSRPLPGVSHEALIRQLVRDINLGEESVRNMVDTWIEGSDLREEDATKTVGEVGTKFQATIKHFFSQLVIEIQRSVDAFCIQYGVDQVDCIHVCGFGVCYPGLLPHMERSLGIETKLYNPFAGLMGGTQLTKDEAERAPIYAVAVGLAFP